MAVRCLIEDKKSKSKKGQNSDKTAFWIVSLDSMDCSFDNEHIFQVSSLIAEEQNVKDFADDAGQKRRQGYSNTSGFLRKQPS